MAKGTIESHLEMLRANALAWFLLLLVTLLLLMYLGPLKPTPTFSG